MRGPRRGAQTAVVQQPRRAGECARHRGARAAQPLPPELEARFGPDEHRFGNHAGDTETSMMLALQPERVDLAQARHFHSSSQDRAARYTLLGNGRSAKLGWQMQDYNPAGAAGNAAAATADKGHALIDAAARQLALLLQEIAHLPLSTLVDKPQF